MEQKSLWSKTGGHEGWASPLPGTSQGPLHAWWASQRVDKQVTCSRTKGVGGSPHCCLLSTQKIVGNPGWDCQLWEEIHTRLDLEDAVIPLFIGYPESHLSSLCSFYSISRKSQPSLGITPELNLGFAQSSSTTAP